MQVEGEKREKRCRKNVSQDVSVYSSTVLRSSEILSVANLSVSVSSS